MDRGVSNAVSASQSAILPLLERVRTIAQAAGVFGGVSVRNGMLVCLAKGSGAPASYRLFAEGGKTWVSLVMADRWLSESIEADLMHAGDKMEDLLEEELVDQGAPTTRLKVDHFRSDDLLFTYRSALSGGTGPEQADGYARVLLAYEACFRNLGDMDAGDDEG